MRNSTKTPPEMQEPIVLSEAALQARREYQKKWRKANPDKVREKNRRYWEKVAAKRKEAQEHEMDPRDPA